MKNKVWFLTIWFFLCGRISLFAGVKFISAFDHEFDQPLFMQWLPEEISGFPDLYAIIEQDGRIVLSSMKNSRFSSQKKILYDIRHKVCSDGNEEGLLGMAISPFFKKDRAIYIYYSLCSPRRTRVSRLTAALLNGKSAEDIKNLQYLVREENLLEISQPYSNHNGGMLAFGKDQFLYIGVGDGGAGGDPHNNAQNLKTRLGKLLRIDVSKTSGYAIPVSNPFFSATNKITKEIYAFGLRNPWRFSFDRKNGQLILADVGQDHYEEIDIILPGKNYGWRNLEGFHCYDPEKNCGEKDKEYPIFEYGREFGFCVTGGYVYRGQKIKSLYGKYIFGDYVSRKIWQIDLTNYKKIFSGRAGKPTEISNQYFSVASFSEDKNGEIYLIDLKTDQIYRMVE